MKNRLVGITTLVALMFLVGCATFQNNAGKTLAMIAETVDAGMKGWAAYVVISKTVSPQQESQVKAAYEKYQAAMATAQAAYNGLATSAGKPAWDQALTALQASEGTLLQLWAAFNPTPKTIAAAANTK